MRHCRLFGFQGLVLRDYFADFSRTGPIMQQQGVQGHHGGWHAWNGSSEGDNNGGWHAWNGGCNAGTKDGGWHAWNGHNQDDVDECEPAPEDFWGSKTTSDTRKRGRSHFERQLIRQPLVDENKVLRRELAEAKAGTSFSSPCSSSSSSPPLLLSSSPPPPPPLPPAPKS